ncbi:hypothetical protein [Bradyrhizobium sp. BR 10261]|uniref:hypothetical protein n=1 Tax=Bradyrhizobium sp. BR 10261 TaxID=2749992 RepID=UPI001C64EDE1|nr:hypothetical protein [Bradyrhizobium sp. BR 10261]MBW7962979.1 hypothetical protein [Bradyrhizobium sp. BR 10261]
MELTMTKSKLSNYAPLQPPCGEARVLTKADFTAIMDLREVVFAALPNRQFLYPEDDDESFIRDHLGLEGMSVGIFDGGQLIGFTNVTLPDGNRLGEPWLGIPGRRVQRHHALLMNGIVRPGFEGNGLHKYLIAERLRIAEADNRPLARVLASPYNYRSWGNFIWHGFIVKGFIRPYEPKFGTLLRYVMDVDARQKLVGNRETSVLVDSRDIEKQEAYFEQGMLGFNRVMDGPTASIELMHPIEPPIEY